MFNESSRGAIGPACEFTYRSKLGVWHGAFESFPRLVDANVAVVTDAGVA